MRSEVRAAVAAGLLALAIAADHQSAEVTNAASGSSGTATAGGSQSTANCGNCQGNNGNGNGNGGSTGNANKAFTASGSVTNLRPGVPVVLPVQVANPNAQDIKILTLTATATSNKALCPVTTSAATNNVVVTAYDASTSTVSYVAPGRGAVTLPLQITLVDSPVRNQDACKGATFTLTYSGTARSTT